MELQNSSRERWAKPNKQDAGGRASKRMQFISDENLRSKSKNEMPQNEKFPIDRIVRLRISEGSMRSP